ncbi:hypothetical protein ACM1RC_31525 [Paenibacillus azoreducens]|uniref:hypothetical protein n=1 Tax=Paenibacillus azoreducens TaxID=116718 RepID=UPI0039F63DC8
MEYTTKYVGLDVAKDSIAVAVADEGREAPRYLGKIPHDLTALRKLLGRLGEPEMLEVCYEAGRMFLHAGFALSGSSVKSLLRH